MSTDFHRSFGHIVSVLLLVVQNKGVARATIEIVK